MSSMFARLTGFNHRPFSKVNSGTIGLARMRPDIVPKGVFFSGLAILLYYT